MGTALCSGATPMCNTTSNTCVCATSPSDSCAGNTTNKACVAGACGCNNALTDCPAGDVCDATNRCSACNRPDLCGSDCGDCRTLASLPEGSYFTCEFPSQAFATGCSIKTCPAGRANCDADDADGTGAGACEADILLSTTNCGGCGLACQGVRLCDQGQCRCGGQDGCPLAQACTQGRCKCTSANVSTECNPGYTCPGEKCTP